MSQKTASCTVFIPEIFCFHKLFKFCISCISIPVVTKSSKFLFLTTVLDPHFYNLCISKRSKIFRYLRMFLLKRFSFLKCLIYMLILILLHFIESSVLLKTSSKNLRLFATIISFTKAICRHPQHIFMIFAMCQVLKIYIFRNFFRKNFDSA
jgi:hypothetical protein